MGRGQRMRKRRRQREETKTDQCRKEKHGRTESSIVALSHTETSPLQRRNENSGIQESGQRQERSRGLGAGENPGASRDLPTTLFLKKHRRLEFFLNG